jgi:hypothetical protein
MPRLIQRARELRLLLWAGVLVFVTGAALDLAVHLLLPANPFPLNRLHSRAENFAHLVTFAGMVLLLGGVLTVPRPRLHEVPASERPREGR